VTCCAPRADRPLGELDGNLAAEHAPTAPSVAARNLDGKGESSGDEGAADERADGEPDAPEPT
jgi:hypothetical protein